MAVPKRKKSTSCRNMRRSHHALKAINVVVDPATGEYKLPHHVCLADGTYNNRKVIIQNTSADNDQDAETA